MSIDKTSLLNILDQINIKDDVHGYLCSTFDAQKNGKWEVLSAKEYDTQAKAGTCQKLTVHQIVTTSTAVFEFQDTTQKNASEFISSTLNDKSISCVDIVGNTSSFLTEIESDQKCLSKIQTILQDLVGNAQKKLFQESESSLWGWIKFKFWLWLYDPPATVQKMHDAVPRLTGTICTINNVLQKKLLPLINQIEKDAFHKFKLGNSKAIKAWIKSHPKQTLDASQQQAMEMIERINAIKMAVSRNIQERHKNETLSQ